MCWIPLTVNKHKQRNQDMNPPTNKTGTLLQTRHKPSYKQLLYLFYIIFVVLDLN